jgi:hypothetical protein
MLSRDNVLPDGLTAREAATSWRVYRFGWFDLSWPGRWPGFYFLMTAEDLG